MADGKRWVDPRCTELDLPEGVQGPFIELGDGRLMTVQDNTTLTSADNGKTWEDRGPVYTGPKPGVPEGGVLIRTRDGVVVMVYADKSTFKWGWDDATGTPHDDVRGDVWTVRSLDDGETWIDRQRIMEGYCGAIINMIETDRGPIVVPVQMLLYDPGRTGQPTFVSYDNGKTWDRSNIIDLGGHGHHDGAAEATVIELLDRSLYMLIRTNLDYFWEAYSMDEGLSWRIFNPSKIDASSAPGHLARLASGRIALVWNRLYPQGQDSYPRRGGQYSNVEASWHREELSIAFSEDEARTWSEPVVFARDEGGVSYPRLFERRPGELWVTTWFQGNLRVSLREEDFVS